MSKYILDSLTGKKISINMYSVEKLITNKKIGKFIANVQEVSAGRDYHATGRYTL